jgi:hypothetical protein
LTAHCRCPLAHSKRLRSVWTGGHCSVRPVYSQAGLPSRDSSKFILTAMDVVSKCKANRRSLCRERYCVLSMYGDSARRNPVAGGTLSHRYPARCRTARVPLDCLAFPGRASQRAEMAHREHFFNGTCSNRILRGMICRAPAIDRPVDVARIAFLGRWFSVADPCNRPGDPVQGCRRIVLVDVMRVVGER